MPKFFAMPNLLNQISGIAEMILGIGLLFTATRQLSAYLIIAMLVVFFAVHIPHLITPPKMANGKILGINTSYSYSISFDLLGICCKQVLIKKAVFFKNRL
jgi:uncharacterized membrane protein YphA (DoxX/SURF4 family)